MSISIDDTSNHTSITIDEVYKLFLVENVTGYIIVDYSTLRPTIQNNEIGEKSYYFVIDTMGHEAFAHWVFESAIYLPIFKSLKEKYKNIKLHMRRKKQFKVLFLNFFNIDESDIVYDFKPNNICLFPSPISCLINKSLTEAYKTIFSRFIKIFHEYESNPQQTHEYVFLPRQTKENHINNDRVYDTDFIFKFLETKNKYVLNTDSVTDLKAQIEIIRSAPKVILTDGSPLLVNNMFCKNQTIHIVIDTMTINQAQIYPKMKNIIDFISAFNNNVIKYTKRDLSLL